MPLHALPSEGKHSRDAVRKSLLPGLSLECRGAWAPRAGPNPLCPLCLLECGSWSPRRPHVPPVMLDLSTVFSHVGPLE